MCVTTLSGAGRWKRCHWIFFLWTPDEMTRNAPASERTKKNKERMKHVSWKPQMQKLLSPWNVTVTADSLEKVTIEEWILRVRRVLSVDGDDEFLNAQSFLKALEEERLLFEAKKAEREARKKAELERKKAVEEEEQV